MMKYVSNYAEFRKYFSNISEKVAIEGALSRLVDHINLLE